MQLTGQIWYPYTQMETAPDPLFIDHGINEFLYTSSGKKYLDAISSWWVNIHGHAHPAIAQAIGDQAKQLEQVIFAGCTHAPALEFSKVLLEMTGIENGKVYFSDNGSTAVEIALKMAIQFFYNQGIKKNKIVTFENDFHGETFGAMSVSDQDGFNAPFKKYLFDVLKLPIPKDLNDHKSWTHVESIFSDSSVAAFIFEPIIQGAGGMQIYSPEVLNQMIEIARSNGVIIIADEVMTGCYRTGTFLATDQIINCPDIICMAKGITGGFLPMAVTIAQSFIFEAFLSNEKQNALLHGHSYTGNPISCAAGLASLNLMQEKAFIDQVHNICSWQKEKTKHYQSKYPLLSARCCGTIFAINILTENVGYFSNIQQHITQFFMENGVFTRPLGNVLYFMPPLCIQKESFELFFTTLDLFLSDIQE